jgi:hypothetical protein
MKRKNQKRKPLQMVVNQKVLDIIEDPAVIEYIARKLIRRRPAFTIWIDRKKNQRRCAIGGCLWSKPYPVENLAGH